MFDPITGRIIDVVFFTGLGLMVGIWLSLTGLGIVKVLEWFGVNVTFSGGALIICGVVALAAYLWYKLMEWHKWYTGEKAEGAE